MNKTVEFGVAQEIIEHELGPIAVFTVHGRTKINLVGQSTLRAVADALLETANNSQIRCAVIQGKNDQAFIGGADLKELGSLDTESARDFILSIHDVCQAIRDFPVPVIGRIQGYCLGAGLEIAAACDFRIADLSATFGMPEVKVGVPSVVEAALLPQLIGWGKTRELVYRGNLLDADEAERIHLVEQIARETDIGRLVADAVSDILSAAPGAIRLQKQLCRTWESSSIDDAIQAGVDTFSESYQSDEPRRYVDAFFRENKKKQAGD